MKPALLLVLVLGLALQHPAEPPPGWFCRPPAKGIDAAHACTCKRIAHDECCEEVTEDRACKAYCTPAACRCKVVCEPTKGRNESW